MKNIEISRFCITTTPRISNHQAHLFRGYMINKCPDPVLYNRDENDKSLHRYPQVQFKVINGVATIIAFGDGIPIVKEIFCRLDTSTVLNIADKEIRIKNLTIELSKEEIGISSKKSIYKFITPWVPLNSRTFQEYRQSSREEQAQIMHDELRDQLTLLLSNCNYRNTSRLRVNILKLHRREANIKDTYMRGYVGDWESNIILPNLLSIGKGSARGYGCAIRM